MYKFLIILLTFLQLSAAQQKISYQDKHGANPKLIHLSNANSYDMAILLLINGTEIKAEDLPSFKRQCKVSLRDEERQARKSLRSGDEHLKSNEKSYEFARLIILLKDNLWAQYGQAYIQYLTGYKMQYLKLFNQDWNPLIPDLNNIVNQNLFNNALEVYPGTLSFDEFVDSVDPSLAGLTSRERQTKREIKITQEIMRLRVEFELEKGEILPLLIDKSEPLDDRSVIFYKKRKPGCCVIS